MFSVAVFTIPGNRFPLVDRLKGYARPYMFVTSQWQQWDIFSPDPLRRVTLYHIERSLDDGGWELLFPLDPWNIARHRRAKELKILGRIEDDWRVLATPYLENACRATQPKPIAVRLVARSVVLPMDLPSLQTMSTRQLPSTENVLGMVRCPATGVPSESGIWNMGIGAANQNSMYLLPSS